MKKFFFILVLLTFSLVALKAQPFVTAGGLLGYSKPVIFCSQKMQSFSYGFAKIGYKQNFWALRAGAEVSSLKDRPQNAVMGFGADLMITGKFFYSGFGYMTKFMIPGNIDRQSSIWSVKFFSGFSYPIGKDFYFGAELGLFNDFATALPEENLLRGYTVSLTITKSIE